MRVSLKSEELSARERIEVALDHLVREQSNKLTITEVCRFAEVSRSNLYDHHPDLVERIRGYRRPATKKSKNDKPIDQLRAELKGLEARCEALTLVCLEQQLIIESQAKSLKRAANTTSAKARRGYKEKARCPYCNSITEMGQ